MTTNRNRAAEILHRHHDNCNDAADALDATGVLAPDFTGSISENEAGRFFISKSTIIGADNFARVNNPDWVKEGPTISVNSRFMNPTEARELAAAILVAADHAEKAAAHLDEATGDTDE